MFESLRRMMLIGLGAADFAADKMKQSIDELVSRGEISVEEGRKLFEEFTNRADEQRRSARERMRTEVRNILNEIGVADRAQVALLEAKIEALERRMDELSMHEQPVQS